MASPRPQTTMENLPTDIISNIFIRLLAKQLSQMRCMCKSWNALLSESSFVNSHLHFSTQNNDEILLFFSRRFSVDGSTITACPSRSPDIELTNFIKCPFNPEPQYTRGSVIGSVNGLICLKYNSCYDDVIAIWNPSLSAVLTLPRFSLRFDVLREIHFRFGFDPKTNDYKVVKLTSLYNPRRMAPQVEVYSMRKGSWELISQEFPSHITWIKDQNEVCVDGHDGRLHWLGYIDKEMKAQTIVAFDLGVETFHEIALPDFLLNHNGNRLNYFGIWAGNLCVMSAIKGGKCEVWVMDEYGVDESWVKHHVFSQFSGNIIPYGFTLRNEFLFRSDYSCDPFGLYDLVRDKTKTFKIMSEPYIISRIVGYVDSLVWIEQPVPNLKRH